MSSRDEVLAAVRGALADVKETDPVTDVPIPWEFGQPTPMPDVVTRFVERVGDYGATVVRCAPEDLKTQVDLAVAESGAVSVVLPPGLDQSWHPGPTVWVRSDDPPLSAQELDKTDAVVTAAAVGVAETGTIILDHRPDQGRRALTLVPDRHVCVVRADQVVSDIPEAITRLRPSVIEGLPLTMISGPSATSDIELNRVEGVHGPRTLWVILVD